MAPQLKSLAALGAGFVIPAVLIGLVLIGGIVMGKGAGARAGGRGWDPGADAVRFLNAVLGNPEPVAAQPAGGGAPAVASPQYANLLPWPFRITSQFGQYPNGGAHYGLDLDVTYGVIQTAPVGGVVEQVERGCGEGDPSCGKGWGNHVWWQSDVTGNHILLAHFSRLEDWVQVGARFEAGKPIGVTGSTGFSSGPHAHIQVNPERCCENPGSTNPAWEFPNLRCGEPVLRARFGAQCDP